MQGTLSCRTLAPFHSSSPGPIQRRGFRRRPARAPGRGPPVHHPRDQAQRGAGRGRSSRSGKGEHACGSRRSGSGSRQNMKSGARLRSLRRAKRLRWREHPSKPQWQQELQQLGVLTDLEFDRAFLKWQLQMHLALVKLYQTEASQSPETDLAKFAITNLAQIRRASRSGQATRCRTGCFGRHCQGTAAILIGSPCRVAFQKFRFLATTGTKLRLGAAITPSTWRSGAVLRRVHFARVHWPAPVESASPQLVCAVFAKGRRPKSGSLIFASTRSAHGTDGTEPT